MSVREGRKNEKGFSLIEVIVVLIIIGTISSIAYGVILLNAGTFKTLSEELSKRWELRKALRIMREDFSQIDPADIIGFSKSSKAGKRVFFKNLNGDKIFYKFDNGLLLRRQNSQKWEQLASGLEKPPFSFLNSKLNPTKNKKDIAFIKVNLVVKINSKTKSIEDTFFLRNRTRENVAMKKEKKDDDKDKEKDEDDDKDDNDHDKNDNCGHKKGKHD